MYTSNAVNNFMKNLVLINTFFIFCLFPSSAFGATKTYDTFETYTDSTLESQDGGKNWTSPWITDGPFVVQDTFVYTGSNAVQITTTNAEYNALRTFGPLTKGKIHFAMGKDNTSHAPSFIVQSGNTMALLIFIGSDNQHERYWYIREGNTEYKIAPYDMSTYGTVDVQFNINKQQYRASINGGAYTDWYGLINPVSSVDTVRLHGAVTAGQITTNMYWDDIKIKSQ
ncbi:MAG: hypothetical protein RLZZ76_621 [Candidatus Parcubacteria bacterium]|jgi:hypothetical protein